MVNSSFLWVAELYNSIGAEKVAKAIANGIEENDMKDKNVSNVEYSQENYDELKHEISELTETVKLLATELHNIKNPMIYNYIDDNMPNWARDAVKWAVDNNILKGDGDGLNLDDKDLRYIVMIKRISEL